MRRLSLLAAVSVATVLLAAGCGGGSKTYTEDATRACFQKAGVTITPVPGDDFIASNAAGGGFGVRLDDNRVTISFGLDRAGAQLIVRGYQRHKGTNIGLEDVLKPKGNAVVLWASHPSDDDIKKIEGCLK